MAQTAPLSVVRLSTTPSERPKIASARSEMSFRKCMAPEDVERAWFAGLLWRAFPEAKSENDLADTAAEVLSRDGRSVTARTVRNWLRRENTPHFRYVLAVIAMAGAETVFAALDPEAASDAGRSRR